MNTKQNMKNETVEALIVQAIEQLNQGLDRKVDLSAGAATPLFGNHGVLDSLALVSLIVMVEEQVESEFGVSIILASEKAMSRKHGPFGTLGSLTQYVESLIAEQSK